MGRETAVTAMSAASGATLVAHGLHAAIVAAGLWGLAALLLPQFLGRHGRAVAHPPRDEHEARVALLRASIAEQSLGTTVARTLEPPAPTTVPVPLEHGRPALLTVPLAAVASLAAAGIHAAVAPSHLDERTLFGAFFIAAAVVQCAWAAAVLDRPSAWVLRVGLHLNAALIALWAITRTVGLPFGLMPEPHPVGGWDVACVAWQAVAVLMCARGLREAGPAPARDSLPRALSWDDWHPLARGAVGFAGVVLAFLTVGGAHA